MVRRSLGENIFTALNILILSVFAFIVILPLLYVVSSSLVSAKELADNPVVLFPRQISFDAYKLIFLASNDILNGYKVTFFRVITGTSLNIVFSYFIAYALAKDDFPVKKLLAIYFFFILLFNGGIIPYYIIVKSMNIDNTLLVYIIPNLVLAYYVLMLRNFIMQIPASLSESAEIDGAPELVILFKIVLPLSIPAMVTIGIFYAVYHWNQWFDAYLFVSNSKLHPIQMVLREILIRASLTYQVSNATALEQLVKSNPPSRVIQSATVVATTAPIVLIYPFLQKYFIKGIMVGGVKG